MDVTFRCHGEVRPEQRAEFVRLLSDEGIDARECAEGRSPLGIVLFGEAGPRLADVLQETRRDRARLLLAVAAPGVVVPSETAWQILNAGAAELLPWAGTAETAAPIVARLRRWAAVEEVLERPLVRDHLVGKSTAWLRVLRQVVEVACFTNASVLVMGESGTGKELIARLIHTLDGRARKAELVVLDCSAVVPELSGSEFFGHERGAFTGAVLTREGAFAMANEGTLFLDEVGELPPPLQSQLLRVIQERTFKPVGSNTWRKADFRMVCATNRDLTAEVEQGRFRADLYYRIATCVFRLPPLSERVEDILPLARHFLAELTPGVEPPAFSEPVREYLQARRYRGNVRELRQLVSRIGQRHVGNGPITVGDLPEDERPPGFAQMENGQDEQLNRVVRRALALGAGLRDIGQGAADAAIEIAVSEEDGNLQRAARKLGVTDRALQMRRAQRRAS